ncbi:hypothetical protein BKA81DRAFT_144866 [Phyllosticta paracitricarpa]
MASLFPFTCSRASHREAIGNWDAHLDRPRVPQIRLPSAVASPSPLHREPSVVSLGNILIVSRSPSWARFTHCLDRRHSSHVSPELTRCKELDLRPTCDAVPPELHFLPISIIEGLIRAPRQSLRFQLNRNAGAMYCRQINVTRQHQQQPRGLIIGPVHCIGANTPQIRRRSDHVHDIHNCGVISSSTATGWGPN